MMRQDRIYKSLKESPNLDYVSLVDASSKYKLGLQVKTVGKDDAVKIFVSPKYGWQDPYEWLRNYEQVMIKQLSDLEHRFDALGLKREKPVKRKCFLQLPETARDPKGNLRVGYLLNRISQNFFASNKWDNTPVLFLGGNEFDSLPPNFEKVIADYYKIGRAHV